MRHSCAATESAGMHVMTAFFPRQAITASCVRTLADKETSTEGLLQEVIMPCRQQEKTEGDSVHKYDADHAAGAPALS